MSFEGSTTAGKHDGNATDHQSLGFPESLIDENKMATKRSSDSLTLAGCVEGEARCEKVPRLSPESPKDRSSKSPRGAGRSNPESIYEPLDPSRREIRLLRIENMSQDGLLECSFHTASLDDEIDFSALSYVWGDESITKDVLVNGNRRSVTKNLESALRNFWEYAQLYNDDFRSPSTFVNGKSVYNINRESLSVDGDDQDGSERGLPTLQSRVNLGLNKQTSGNTSASDGDGSDGNDDIEACSDMSKASTDDETDNSNERESDDGHFTARYYFEGSDGQDGGSHIQSMESDVSTTDEYCSDDSDSDVDDAFKWHQDATIRSRLQRYAIGRGITCIWADALCINQADQAEKASQIQWMHDIYSRASHVFSWLGSSDDINLALKTIRRMAAHLWQTPLDSEWLRNVPYLYHFHAPDSTSLGNKFWRAIATFSQSEYFTRLWIFQEIMSNDQTTFISESEYLHMFHLESYQRWADSLGQNFDEEPPSCMASQPQAWPILRLMVSNWDFDVINDKLAIDGQMDPIQKLGLFLRQVSSKDCKNPLDKVFGVLGILPMDIVPDYSLSVSELYLKWATESGWDIPPGLLLCYSGVGIYPGRSPELDLPSWLPDLTAVRLLGAGRWNWRVDTGDFYQQVPKIPYHLRPIISRTCGLTCFGVQVAEVHEVVTCALQSKGKFSIVKGPEAVLPLMQYLVNNIHRFSTEYPCNGRLRLWALVQTLLEPSSELPGFDSDMTKISSLKLIWDILLGQIKAIAEGPFGHGIEPLGFTSEEDMWDFFGNILTDDDDSTPLSELELVSSNWKELQIGFNIGLKRFLYNRSLCHFSNGLLGAGPPGIQLGDAVYLIHGSLTPLLLRQVNGKLINVGPCFVYGLAGEEGLQALTDREDEIHQLTIT